ncbi:RNA polymerase sigma factor SigJ [Hyphomonas johnsonii]|uniref:ECF subfamily RNA polymerase sigma-24 subunit n=1 Tax=Hyphomonas johnsonii MHS-2 TaxID=1280950 RepID=A0A059FJR3_9PROT|nr:RNA polymerase sigma factor SigJ [Hyphomonas johnsonii]KCZ90718.1 ECF subfamily RNA polymerase sigma-24 subunit [Hyphomonas johnsonii MHS-2]
MNTATAIFEAERPKLTALCYRMLGEQAGAEDAVQDTWLRWSAVEPDAIDNPAAWLRRAATNIAIDALRSARAKREVYPGPWLPEPLFHGQAQDAGARFEIAQECELALLWAMERLSPAERAAFILREAFDAGYDEIAATLGKSQAACRQLVSRAHRRLQESGPRFDAPNTQVRELIARFLAAVANEDFETATRLLAPDAVAISDGGRKARAALRPLIGAEEIITVFASVMRKSGAEVGWRLEMAKVNGAPALVRWLGGRVDMVLTLSPDSAGRIAWFYMMRNPDKLQGAPAYQ